MNIVFDDGLRLDDNYRTVLAPLLPLENAPLRLNAATSKTDGTPCSDEGFVFLTHLPIDVLKYHSEFFKFHSDAPQWFFILLNRSDHGLTDLKNAARKHDLKNCMMFHAKDMETFEAAVKEVSNAKRIIKGKTLLLSKHKRNWTADLANLLFGDNKNKYEIMDVVTMSDTNAQFLLLCGEKASDFKGMVLPDKMEPYFIFRFRDELQQFINEDALVEELAKYHHMTAERIESRLYFLDIESEIWLSKPNRTSGGDAVTDGILLWDQFGLPVSRSEYTEMNIAAAVLERHKNMEKIRKILV